MTYRIRDSSDLLTTPVVAGLQQRPQGIREFSDGEPLLQTTVWVAAAHGAESMDLIARTLVKRPDASAGN
jgi:hypothetical protein